MKNVLVTAAIRESGMEILRKNTHLTVSPSPEPSEVIRHLNGIHALITRTTPIGPEIIAQGKELEVIACHGTGTDFIDLAAAAERGIRVLNVPGVNARSVAEFAVCMMLTLCRKLAGVGSPKDLLEQFSRRDRLFGNDLFGKTVGIVGLGKIGTRVAGICSAGFGMQVRGFDPNASDERFTALGVQRADDIGALLIGSDIVTLHCPLTPETKGLIGKAQLAAMKSTAYLINTARAELVSKPDLVDALVSGRIAGAAADVFSPEPPAVDDPLLQAPNLIATPHIAAGSIESINRASETVAMDVCRVLDGKPPMNPVV